MRSLAIARGVWGLAVLMALAGCGPVMDEGGAASGPEQREQSMRAGRVPLTGEPLWVQRADTPAVGNSQVAHDREGNVIVAVSFSATIDFGKGPLGGTTPDFRMGVAKFGPDGALRWVRVFEVEPGSLSPTPFATGAFSFALAVDRRGNIALSGRNDGRLDFGGGPLEAGAFLVKLDAQGRHVWSRRLGGNNVIADELAVDASGNVLLGGSFEGTMDLGRGPLRSDPRPGPDSLVSHNAFVARFTPSGRNEWTFVERLGRGFGAELTVDSEAHVLFVNNIFVETEGTERADLLVRRIAPDGTPRWTRRLEGLGNASGIATHGNRILLTGLFQGRLTFGRTVLEAGEEGMIASYLFAYTRDGDERWARRIEGATVDLGADIRDGVVVLGLGSALPATGGEADMFVTKFDRIRGTVLWRREFPLTIDDGVLSSLSVTRQGESVITGFLGRPVDFGLDPVVPQAGHQLHFILKLAP
ncbi:hypothetical protein [Archangium sp.]|uniref:hypothetical protein n=1 Tax=Archangium sp. TaxID=1872627 RepID=UPI00286A8892|nr:hypothetical protein [Archangium sp.]